MGDTPVARHERLDPVCLGSAPGGGELSDHDHGRHEAASIRRRIPHVSRRGLHPHRFCGSGRDRRSGGDGGGSRLPRRVGHRLRRSSARLQDSGWRSPGLVRVADHHRLLRRAHRADQAGDRPAAGPLAGSRHRRQAGGDDRPPERRTADAGPRSGHEQAGVSGGPTKDGRSPPGGHARRVPGAAPRADR